MGYSSQLFQKQLVQAFARRLEDILDIDLVSRATMISRLEEYNSLRIEEPSDDKYKDYVRRIQIAIEKSQSASPPKQEMD